MAHMHHDWLQKWQREVQEDYRRLHALAARDPQRSGHGGEATWLRLLQEWLPPAYEVGTRKYIIPEEGGNAFETDLVIFNPGYPAKLRDREEILAGGVAAAFSVKLTLDASGTRDGVKRAALLRQGMKSRFGSPRTEMTGPFAVGLLAHSHNWKAPGSTPRENLASSLWTLDHEFVKHPRESLDLVCVADLTTISTMRVPFIPSQHLVAGSTVEEPGIGVAMTAMTMADEDDTPGPVAVFITSLIIRLAQADPSISLFADGLRLTEGLGTGSGKQRHFALADVFSDRTIDQLPVRGLSDNDWASAFF